MAAPKAFISYAWTSPNHQAWVLDLATQLRENGVDVILDKWDLKEGHDAIAFMEKMVTDPEVTKVIITLNRNYAEKADARLGGVGTESQIISPNIYEKADQNKFCGVLSEVSEDGSPFTPTFYRSRIYIDLSNSDIYGLNFEQLLRWIYDKPAYPKPSLGRRPEYLEGDALHIPTRAAARKAIESVKNGSLNSIVYLDDYLQILGDNLKNMCLSDEKIRKENFDDDILTSIDSFIPYRDEYITVISATTRYSELSDITPIHRFFEKAGILFDRPESSMLWKQGASDSIKFVVHELLLITTAIMLKNERFQAVKRLMIDEYYIDHTRSNGANPMRSFTIFRQHLESLKNRNIRLKLNRASIHADLLHKRIVGSGISENELMQADFVLWFFDAVNAYKNKTGQSWWPETLLYYKEYESRFEIFFRAESVSYFNRITSLIGVTTKSELEEILNNFGRGRILYLPEWHMHTFPLRQAINIEKIATRS